MDVLEKFYGSAASTLGRIIEGIDDGNIESLDEIEDIEQLKDLASEAPVIRLVNLSSPKRSRKIQRHSHRAVRKGLKVRYRVDASSTMSSHRPKSSRRRSSAGVKIMAKLNIAERRLPQDDASN